MRLISFEVQLQRAKVFEDFVIQAMQDQHYTLVRRSDTKAPDLGFMPSVNIDCKYKDRMQKYAATGFNHEQYLEFLQWPDVFVLFMEPKTGRMYGQWLDVLSQNICIEAMPVKNDGKITAFHLECMRSDWLKAIKERLV